MKIAVLTSSRADFSILSPLLYKLKKDKFFDLNIIAFGSHLSTKHGKTISLIRKDGFKVTHSFNTNSTFDTAIFNFLNLLIQVYDLFVNLG